MTIDTDKTLGATAAELETALALLEAELKTSGDLQPREPVVRHLADFHVSALMLAEILAPGFHAWKIEAGPPVGARVIEVFYEYRNDTFVVRLEHESFSPCPEQAHVPQISVEVMSAFSVVR